MCGIYKITNLVNNKSYVGQSINIEERFKKHKTRAFNSSDRQYESPLYRAIRKYGIDNFSFEIVEICEYEDLDKMEIYYVKIFESYGEKGYNLTPGGNQPRYFKLSDEIVLAIINRLKTSFDNCELIAEDFDVSPRTVASINTGDSWHQDGESYPIRSNLAKLKSQNTKRNHCAICGKAISTQHKHCADCVSYSQRKTARPEPLELARLISSLGFEKVGKIFGVSGKAVSKWCKGYGLPYTKKEICAWYEERRKSLNDIDRKEVESGLVRPVNQIDPISGEIINTFPNQLQAAKYLGRNNGSHIGKACCGDQKTAYGYVWEFA